MADSPSLEEFTYPDDLSVVDPQERLGMMLASVSMKEPIIVARDDGFLMYEFADGELLPVWNAERHAKAALPNWKEAGIEFVKMSAEEFEAKFSDDEDVPLYISVMLDKDGHCVTMPAEEFFESMKKHGGG